ncbi:MAG: hypothetical protein QG585_39 [Patescibacteria group bacterium]|jgi:hypothetical protein|nr:hypothetical protein [Patescibacteria group bacterium]
MIIVPNRFNVIAKARIKRGVDEGKRGWWMETTPDIIRRNNRLVAHFTDEALQHFITKYSMQFVVIWENDPDQITLHPADDERLQFIDME